MRKLLSLLICLGPLCLGACSQDELGRALYNTGKNYCKQVPNNCSTGDPDRLR